MGKTLKCKDLSSNEREERNYIMMITFILLVCILIMFLAGIPYTIELIYLYNIQTK